ncbi:MAG: CoA transferase [Alphaproteobacteria bacterium]
MGRTPAGAPGGEAAELGPSLVLDGVRVLELGGGIASAFATHLLGGYGADVVRVEEPRRVPSPPTSGPTFSPESAW